MSTKQQERDWRAHAIAEREDRLAGAIRLPETQPPLSPRAQAAIDRARARR